MNKQDKIISITRIVLGMLASAAILTQLASSIMLGRSVTNFFSFFTIESNIFGAVLLITLGVLALRGKSTERLTFVRGGVTLFMTMTGIIYVLLLSGNEVSLQTTIPWVNLVLHYVMPAVFIVDWLFFPPVRRIAFKQAALWLAFPILYLTYSIVRGGIVGWYPYPFINPVMNGWPHVIIMSIVIAITTIVLARLLTLRTPRNMAR